MLCWKLSCYYSVVSVPAPLCLTCMSTHSTCQKRDRPENMLSTLPEQVIKLQACMEEKVQLLRSIFFHFKMICTRTCKCYFCTLQTCVKSETGGEWSSSEELLQQRLTWCTPARCQEELMLPKQICWARGVEVWWWAKENDAGEHPKVVIMEELSYCWPNQKQSEDSR